VVSHISRKTSEMWGTRHWLPGRDLGIDKPPILFPAVFVRFFTRSGCFAAKSWQLLEISMSLRQGLEMQS
jgi:hypothetical protein